jgi:8-oxo-dGTP diphosphatase
VSGLRLRPAARALVLDPDDRVLLLRFVFPPDSPDRPSRTVWVPPGGGLEPGEDHVAAVRRELAEELGLDVDDPGPVVWTRTHVVPLASGRWDGQQERIFVIRCPAFDPAPRLSREQLAAELVFGMRWWTPDELDASDADFAPSRLPELLRGLLREGVPSEPVDVGV